ncbi:MAG: Crp/Fnr family transcriptional regulator [Cryomorphaceae bacterium]|nr:Crp/Fnr family transcriptional regulator [Cryomorphaceae bacterium]
MTIDLFDPKDLRAVVKSYVDASDEALNDLFGQAEKRHFKKNSFVIHQGEEPCSFVFIESGCLMTYLTDDNGYDHVLMFGFSGWWTGDIKGITNEIPSDYSIKALADTEVYMFSKNQFETLCEAHPVFERYFRKIFQNSLVSNQKRVMRQISANAEEKYKAFRTRFPKLELMVAQKHIASYLGITPEFFSSLRKRL